MAFTPLRPTDLLDDPTLTRLNNYLQTLFANLPSGATVTIGGWSDFVLNVAGATGMVVASLALTQAKWQQANNQVLLSIDVGFVLSGSAGNKLTVTIPTSATPPASKNTVLSPLVCDIIQASATVPGSAVLTNGAIVVTKYDNSNFATSACRLLISGAYRV